MLACLRGTDTDTGLKVEAFLVEKVYQKGIKVSKELMKALAIERYEVCPRWNYTIKLRLLLNLSL